jgi:hypothetical protein
MKKFNQTEKQAFEQRHPRKPIKYWEARDKVTGAVVDENNSIKILRGRHEHSCSYHAIR